MNTRPQQRMMWILHLSELDFLYLSLNVTFLFQDHFVDNQLNKHKGVFKPEQLF